MPNDSTPVEKLSQLAQEAQSFFEQVRSEPTNAWRLSEWTWGHLSREQQAIAERLGRDLRQQMALLVPAIQNAPLARIKARHLLSNIHCGVTCYIYGFGLTASVASRE